MIRGVEDYVEYIAVELALDRHHALEVVNRKRDLGTSRKKGGERWSSPMQHDVSTE